jgi:hypothetical protein
VARTPEHRPLAIRPIAIPAKDDRQHRRSDHVGLSGRSEERALRLLEAYFKQLSNLYTGF